MGRKSIDKLKKKAAIYNVMSVINIAANNDGKLPISF
jgi:hypothetical protein